MLPLNQLSLVISTLPRLFDRLPEDRLLLTSWFTETNQWDEYKSAQTVAESSAEDLELLRGMFQKRGVLSIFLAAISKFQELLSIHVFEPKRVRNAKAQEAAEYFFYAGTQNQLDSMITTINYLAHAGRSVKVVVPRLSKLQSRNIEIEPENLAFGSLAAIGTFFSILLRFRSLHMIARRLTPIPSLQALDLLVKIHVSTASFAAALASVEPKFVIVANDHNPEVLSLLEIARARGIWTCYLQHASVFETFPALNFDISFLDGEKAFRDYRNCEHHIYDAALLLPRRYVVLSGMKKPLPPKSLTTRTKLGIALSKDTDPEPNLRKLREFLPGRFEMTVRAHPGTSTERKRQIKYACNAQQMAFSDPSKEPIGTFLAKVSAVIGGSSSILLEAAISGARSVYFEPLAGRMGDPYGFVNGGIATACRSWEDLTSVISDNSIASKRQPIRSIRHFHASFGTPWEGREGDLVGEILATFDGAKPSIADIDSDWIREMPSGQ